MPAADFLQRRVKARKDDDDSPGEFEEFDSADEEQDLSVASSDENEDAEAPSDNASSEQEDDRPSDDSDTPSTPPSPHSALADISFGALASAAASISHTHAPSRKRSRSPSPFHEAAERAAGQKAPRISRASKHAPTELSSKKAVSRKRSVIHAPHIVARDPRFSAASGRVDQEKVNKNYGFLAEYRVSEIAALKERGRKTKDEGERERLGGEVKRLEDRERARKRAEEEERVVREHKKAEREQVRQGKTPYFLKKGEVKRQVLTKRFEAMGEKKAEKAMERRRKKKASREKRSMPFNRRTA